MRKLCSGIYQVITFSESDEIENGEDYKFILYSPTVDRREIPFIQKIKEKGIKVVLLLDFNHFEYDDYKKDLELALPDLVISPLPVNYPNTILCESLYLNEIKKTIKPKTSVQEGLCFISQPLGERNLGFNQFDVLQTFIKENQNEFQIYFKPHPREEKLPADLASRIKIWDRGIDEALASFEYFAGFNSLALLGAECLGHKVFWLSENCQLSKNYRKNINYNSTLENLFKKFNF